MKRSAEDMAASWRQRAACRGEPVDLWFPERGEKSEIADAVCATCPVAAPCREYGEGEFFGIWGGDRASERREARRMARLGDPTCLVCGFPPDQFSLCQGCGDPERTGQLTLF